MRSPSETQLLPAPWPSLIDRSLARGLDQCAVRSPARQLRARTRSPARVCPASAARRQRSPLGVVRDPLPWKRAATFERSHHRTQWPRHSVRSAGCPDRGHSGSRRRESRERAQVRRSAANQGRRSERELQCYSCRPRKGRMRVDVVDSIGRFASKTRRVEVVDVGDVSVEQVEQLEYDASPARDVVAGFAIPQRRRLGLHACIFDERARSEMPYADTPEERPARLNRNASRNHPIESTRNVVAGRVGITEAGSRKRQVPVNRQPRRQTCVVRPLDANAATRTTSLRRSGVSDEQQLGIDAEVPESDCRLEPTNAHGSQTDLSARGANERRDAVDTFAGSTRIVAPRASLL